MKRLINPLAILERNHERTRLMCSIQAADLLDLKAVAQ